MKGAILEFVELNCDVPIPRSSDRILAQVGKVCAGATQMANANYLLADLWRAVLRPLRKELRQRERELTPLMSEAQTIWLRVQGDANLLLAQGDKGTRGMVLCALAALACWLRQEFFEDPDHVELLYWIPESVRCHLYLMHLMLLPARIHVFDWGKWSGCEFYSYLTFKEKCPVDGLRTAQKPVGQHRCVRRASASFLPVRAAELLAARGMEAMAKADGYGPTDRLDRDPHHHQVFSCQELVTAIQLMFYEMEFFGDCLTCCALCHGGKPPPVAVHGDSSAMYDEVLEAVVEEEYEKMKQRGSNRTGGHQAVGVQRDGNHQAYLCGRGERPDFAARRTPAAGPVPP